jgi:protein SCO1/2
MWLRQILNLGVQAIALSGVLALPPDCKVAAEEAHQHSDLQTHSSTDKAYQATIRDYALPQLMLLQADGTQVRFPADIDDGRPVLLNFIYTSCTAICPLLTHTFAAFQARLGPEMGRVRLVSVSIDPEQDTPGRLAEYAARYNTGPHWTFYTGTVEASSALQTAFDANYGDKMNHHPVVFLRRAPGQHWLRLEGFVTPDDLVREYRRLLAGG